MGILRCKKTILQSNPFDPNQNLLVNQIVGRCVGGVATAVGVGNLKLVPVAEQKGFAAGGRVETKDVVEVVLFHDQDEIGPAGVLPLDLLRAVGLHGHLAGFHEGERGVIGGVIDERANARRTHLGRTGGALEFMTQEVFGNRATTDVSGADSQDIVEHGGGSRRDESAVHFTRPPLQFGILLTAGLHDEAKGGADGAVGEFIRPNAKRSLRAPF